MPLKMRVTGHDAQQMGASAEHVFGEAGGTIGRTRNNDWALTDPVVSGKHAVIRCDNGEYYLRDTSTNGTTVNAIPLSRGDERPLHNGDVLRIGKFDIAVEIDSARAVSPIPDASRQADSFFESGHAETLDPLELLGSASRTAKIELPPEGFNFSGHDPQSDHVPAFEQGFEPPRAFPDPAPYRPPPEPHSAEIPADWNETGFGSAPAVQPAPPPAPARPPRPQASQPPPHMSPTDADDSIKALLRAAGVPPHSVNAETYEMLGQIIQVVVQGMIDILRARAQIKDEFRVASTRLKPVENNPLKFSINADDALHNLFGKSNPGYQSPVAAFRDSFEDVKAHQMAMIAGMRAAYQSMLEYFNPEELEAEFDRRLKRGVLGNVLNKTRYWDMYEDLYRSVAKDQEASFHRLFGDEFGKAYEEQMDRLSGAKKRQ